MSSKESFRTSSYRPYFNVLSEFLLTIDPSTINSPYVYSIPNRALLSKQVIELVGFGNPDFLSDIRAIQLIHQRLSASYKEGILLPWAPGDEFGVTSITASCRYFTLREHAGRTPRIPFSPLIDPRGHLNRALNPKIVHTVDNEVDYHQYINTNARTHK